MNISDIAVVCYTTVFGSVPIRTIHGGLTYACVTFHILKYRRSDSTSDSTRLVCGPHGLSRPHRVPRYRKSKGSVTSQPGSTRRLWRVSCTKLCCDKPQVTLWTSPPQQSGHWTVGFF